MGDGSETKQPLGVAYVSNRMNHLNYKVSVVYMGVVYILRHFKEEVAWATDKCLQVICYLKQVYY